MCGPGATNSCLIPLFFSLSRVSLLPNHYAKVIVLGSTTSPILGPFLYKIFPETLLSWTHAAFWAAVIFQFVFYPDFLLWFFFGMGFLW